MPIFVKCYLESLLPSVILKSELQMWLNEEQTWNIISYQTHDIASSMTSETRFPKREGNLGEGLQTFILGIFTTKMLLINRVSRKSALYDWRCYLSY